MATNVTDALVAAWCAALPYPAEDLVGTANDAWAVPQTSQTALGASVAASLSTLSADAAKAALPRWHDASLAAAATTYCVDAAARGELKSERRNVYRPASESIAYEHWHKKPAENRPDLSAIARPIAAVAPAK